MFEMRSFVVGVKESAGVNITLAVLDFATQLLLVLVAGIVLGYLAALIPAYRSTKPPVLEAIQAS